LLPDVPLGPNTAVLWSRIVRFDQPASREERPKSARVSGNRAFDASRHRNDGVLLPALQTTSTASDEGALDALTLVLVVVFIASMVALTALAARRSHSDEAAHVPGPLDNPDVGTMAPPATRPPLEHASARSTERQPAWLRGVVLPKREASLTDASRVIEELLAARRDHDLERGLALYAPVLLDELKRVVGVDSDELRAAFRDASFEGDPPELRSIEIVSAAGERMLVRAGYANGASETYRLVRIDGCWRIEGIDGR
jgi:hypothetical protein